MRRTRESYFVGANFLFFIFFCLFLILRPVNVGERPYTRAQTYFGYTGHGRRSVIAVVVGCVLPIDWQLPIRDNETHVDRSQK